MKFIIEPGTSADIDELEKLYNELNDYLATTINYPGWIHTFVVHPSFLKKGVGHALMDYSLELAQRSGIKSVRLDVYEKNLPAISLYEKCGFEYVDTVDLGLGQYGLDWFRLYERII